MNYKPSNFKNANFNRLFSFSKSKKFKVSLEGNLHPILSRVELYKRSIRIFNFSKMRKINNDSNLNLYIWIWVRYKLIMFSPRILKKIKGFLIKLSGWKADQNKNIPLKNKIQVKPNNSQEPVSQWITTSIKLQQVKDKRHIFQIQHRKKSPQQRQKFHQSMVKDEISLKLSNKIPLVEFFHLLFINLLFKNQHIWLKLKKNGIKNHITNPK